MPAPAARIVFRSSIVVVVDGVGWWDLSVILNDDVFNIFTVQ